MYYRRDVIMQMEVRSLRGAALTGVALCILVTLGLPFLPPGCHQSTHPAPTLRVTICARVTDIRTFTDGASTLNGINIPRLDWLRLLETVCPVNHQPDPSFICTPALNVSENIKLVSCGAMIDIRKFAGGKPTRVGVLLMKEQWMSVLNLYCKQK